MPKDLDLKNDVKVINAQFRLAVPAPMTDAKNVADLSWWEKNWTYRRYKDQVVTQQTPQGTTQQTTYRMIPIDYKKYFSTFGTQSWIKAHPLLTAGIGAAIGAGLWTAVRGPQQALQDLAQAKKLLEQGLVKPAKVKLQQILESFSKK